MIVQNALQCRAFVLCYGSMTPLESFTNDATEIGRENLAIYVYAGDVDIKDGNQTINCAHNQLTNLQSLVKGVVEYKAGANGVSWICINNHPRNLSFDFQLINSGTTTTVMGSEKEKYIVCLDKQIECNQKTITVNSYAKVKNGVEVSVVVPEGSVGLLMTEKQVEQN